jgi:hypothetical protein
VPQTGFFIFIHSVVDDLSTTHLIIPPSNDKVKPRYDKDGKAGEAFAPPVN